MLSGLEDWCPKENFWRAN